MAGDRFYEEQGPDDRRSAPAAHRNREPIAEVLGKWLPKQGLVLEVASGTGEHAVHFAERFPNLDWQPSDIDPSALRSIRAWRLHSKLGNLAEPVVLDACSREWPIDRANALISINMVHISPWSSALGLLDGAARLLQQGAPLILYGPWLSDEIETAASNLQFDSDLKRRNPEWGLRKVEHFKVEAAKRGLALAEMRRMPANNLMILFRKGTNPTAA
jgi:hypothetical protein